MKIVSVEVKKVSIGRFFPKENEVELHISFNDGSEKDIMKKVDVTDPEGAGEGIVTGLRKMERKLNQENDEEKSIIENFVNVVIKEEESLAKDIAKFVHKIGMELEKVNEKKEAEGYLDMIREIKNLKLEF